MIKMLKLKTIINKIPKQVRSFLVKALVFFLVWKFLYIVFLSDSKYIDYPLTTHVAEASTSFLNFVGDLDNFTTERVLITDIIDGEMIEQMASQVFLDGSVVLNIADVCNGLELIVLYIGFIICMPSRFWRKAIYIVIGVLIIDIINILRCAGLICIREYFYIYFDFAHHYLFKAVVYAVTFIMWMVYARKIQFKNETIPV